jgi:hypothetical protein
MLICYCGGRKIMQKDYFKKRATSGGAIGTIFCVFIMLASMITAINISKDTEKNTIEINSLNYKFLFKEPILQSSLTNSKDYTLVEMEGCIAIGKNAGEPMIPVKPISLLLPPMKQVENINIEGTPVVVELNSIDLVDKPIFPYQNSVPFGSAPEEFVIKDNVYSVDAFHPGALQDEYQIGYSRGYAILNILLFPLQYNPVKGILEYYPEMNVNIKLKETTITNTFYRNDPNDESWVEKLVCNPEITDMYTSDIPTFDYPGGLCNSSDNYDYVIITTTENDLDYWDTSEDIPYNWESLMNKHEKDDGLNCTLVTVQDIDACEDYENSNPLFNDQEAHIREFCKDAYQDWKTDYILIGGDDEWIAARHMDTSFEQDIDSDIYWSNLDSTFNDDEDSYWGEEEDSGFDLYAEIFIGRVTCDEPQDVSNWLTKSFYYTDSIEHNYLDNAAFYGGDTGWLCEGDDFMEYSAIKGTDDWLGPDPHIDGPFPTWAGFQFGFETWNEENPNNQYDLSVKWTAEPPNSGWQGGSTSAAIQGLKNDINNNLVTVMSGIAHANSLKSLDVYYDNWESDYHNTKPFFLHDFGCHCGDMDASDDGVLHSMLFHSDTELAFGVVYNTCNGWGNDYCTNSSSAFQAKEFWSYFLDLENKSEDLSNWQLGKGHAFSKDRMAPTINWDYSNGTWRAIIEGCLLFGDPAQKLKTPSDPPETPDAPDGLDEWVRYIECTFSAVTIDPDGDPISYMFDWGDGNFSEWLEPIPSGEIIYESHAWSVFGDYEVRVIARDIWGLVSNWSDAIVISIVENQPPANPTIKGPSSGKGGKIYKFTFVSTDQEGHDIYYYIDWDDGLNTGWIGPYNSGKDITLNHSWNKKGEYFIKAWAKDTLEGTSGQGMLKFNVLTNDKNLNNIQGNRNLFFIKILEKLIGLFPLLEKLLNL